MNYMYVRSTCGNLQSQLPNEHVVLKVKLSPLIDTFIGHMVIMNICLEK